MNTANLQLTVRGLDPKTKDALVKKANQQGLSLNRFVLEALQHGAGVDDSELRYQAMKQFLDAHAISKADKTALDTVVAWSDATSMRKQQSEEHDPRI